MNCFDVFLPLHYECLCASDVWDAKASFYETDSWRAGHRNIPRHCFHPPRHTHHQSTQHLCGAASVCFACGGWLRWDHKLQYWHRVPFYQRNLINFILIRFFFFCSFSYRQSCGYLLQVWCDCKFKHTAFFALSHTWGILLFGCLLIVLLCVELGCWEDVQQSGHFSDPGSETSLSVLRRSYEVP